MHFLKATFEKNIKESKIQRSVLQWKQKNICGEKYKISSNIDTYFLIKWTTGVFDLIF